jgi:type I restriction enzyme S subunit
VDSDYANTKKQYFLKNGDVLFNNTNSRELVGKTCLIKQNIQAVYSNHITRIRVNPKMLVPQYLAVYLHNKWRSGYFAEKCHKWIGQAGIGIEELSSTLIHMPPLEVQQAIIEQIMAEQILVSSSKQLVDMFTNKMQTRINEVWGE